MAIRFLEKVVKIKNAFHKTNNNVVVICLYFPRIKKIIDIKIFITMILENINRHVLIIAVLSSGILSFGMIVEVLE